MQPADAPRPPIRPHGRPARATIDLAALRHNHATLRRLHGGRTFAVLKADAYGHGALRCARALSGGPAPADALAVACVDEALALRAGGITLPILVLEGAFDADELRAAQAAGLWMVVHQASQLAMLDALPAGAALQVWLKLDTGMRRAGLAPDTARAAWDRLRTHPAVGEIAWMSHLACADEAAEAADMGRAATAQQIARFDAATAGLPGARSLANSAALLAWPASRRDWGRPGIALYGAPPVAAAPGDPEAFGLRPVMTLASAVFAVRDVAAGEAVGYGGTWTASRPSRLGLVAIGYADGMPRSVAPGTALWVDGRRCPLAGRVSMDMLMVDLSDHPRAGVGSVVECWGARLPVDELAAAAGTISYELLCGVKRVPVVDAA